MGKQRKKIQKKKKRETVAKARVAKRRNELRESKKIEREIERVRWDARDRHTPYRNPKNDKPEEH